MHLYDSYSYQWREHLEMDLDKFAAMIVANWNSVCTDDTTTVIVGDVGRLCPNTKQVIRSLRGDKVLVVGNHDTGWGSELYNSELFKGTYYGLNYDNLYVQHIPELEPFRRSGATYFIHGHHHRYDEPSMQTELVKYAKDVYRLNCSADLIDYTPRTLQELILKKELLLDKYRDIGRL